MPDRVRFDYSGCRVLITGGTSGIGHATALAFRDAGADVTVTGRRASPADYDVDLGGTTYHPLEMTDRDGIAALARELAGLDVLVNNAGANFPFAPSEWDPDVFEHSIALNLTGTFRMSIACKPLLVESAWPGGAVVLNIASMSSFRAVPIVPAYGAAKAGTVQLTRNLGVAWVGDGIRVNAVAPGLVATGMTAAMKGVPALEDAELAKVPMARWGRPEDIAAPLLFLASPAAAFVTGQTWNVDGGFSAA